MTPLRRKMLEDMRLHGLSERTRESYVGAVSKLARHYNRSPADLSETEIRQFFLHLIDTQKAVYKCSRCAHNRYSYHCCGNRHCPQCRGQAAAKWVEQRRGELLPVAYFLVLTLPPAEFRVLVRANQKTAYRILFKAAAGSLMKLAADERHVGGRIGILAVLHTWSRAMVYHPHVHLLVPGVGLGRDGGSAYIARKNWLVPVKALSILFRARFVEMLQKALPDQSIPTVKSRKKWVVFCKHLDLGPEKVISYLGRYLNRVAVTDSRVRLLPHGDVLVRYRDGNRWGSARLTGHEFIRRYLQHVLPKGLNKVRRYGLFAPANHQALKALRVQLLLAEKPKPAIMPATASPAKPSQDRSWLRCPNCGWGVMEPVRPIAASYQNRSPPPVREAPE